MPDLPNLSEAAYAAAGVAATGFFGMVGNWFLSRKAREERKAKAEETLSGVVDARIRLLLDEDRNQIALKDSVIADRDEQIATLKSEVAQLHATVGSLVTIVRNVLTRGTGCECVGQGQCPIEPNDLAQQLAHALSAEHLADLSVKA